MFEIKRANKRKRWRALKRLGWNCAKNAQVVVTIHFSIREEEESSSRAAAFLCLMATSWTETCAFY